MDVAILTTDGLIHTLEFDAKVGYEVGVPLVPIRSDADRTFDLAAVIELLREDRAHAAARDHAAIRAAVAACARNRVIVTRLPETLTDTAAALDGVAGKTIVFTNALTAEGQRQHLHIQDPCWGSNKKRAGAWTRNREHAQV